MCRRIFVFLLVILPVTIVFGCSGGNSHNPVNPCETGEKAGMKIPDVCGTGTLLGLWQVAVNKYTGDVDIIDMRSGDLIINVLGFMEPPALKNMIVEFEVLPSTWLNEYLEVDVTLKHPIADPIFKGFDVRGVVFGPRLLNADGWTIIPSPEYFKGVPFGYIDGLLGAPDNYADYTGLAGYKYFCDGLGKYTDLSAFMSDSANLSRRGVFNHGPNQNTRHYKLKWFNSGYDMLVFNYAVYANYDWPEGGIPFPVDSFPIATANSAEAFCASITETDNTLYNNLGTGGGSISLMVEVWDWQNNIESVSLASAEPGVIPLQVETESITGGCAYSRIFEFDNVAGTPDDVGYLDIVITAIDPVTHGEAWFMGLLDPTHDLYDVPVVNCWVHRAKVSTSSGWARTWGDYHTEKAIEAEVDSEGNIYVTGEFISHSVDFDPRDDEVDYKQTNGIFDIFLCKYDSSGIYQWTRNIGGSTNDFCGGIAVDAPGNSYVAGYFSGMNVDFDPSPSGSDYHSSNGGYDAFVCKFDTDGNFKWAATWGGPELDRCTAADLDPSGNIMVSGEFHETNIDFDPGKTGTDYHSSNGNSDVFVSKFSADGDFLWARTWGGVSGDMSLGVASDISGNVFTTGDFRGLVDFDPGGGIDEHSSNGSSEVFLTKLSPTGDFLWALTWGGHDWDDGWDVTTDSAGNAYVVGEFMDINVDFDPGIGTAYRSSNGEKDVFLSKFDPSGNFQWVRTWGGPDYDAVTAVAVDDSTNVCVTGGFKDMNLDFDPSAGTDFHDPLGEYDAFLSKFTSNGGFLWARTWGGLDYDYGLGVAFDETGNIIVPGCFGSADVDFNPGSGVDNHSSNGGFDAYICKFRPTGYW